MEADLLILHNRVTLGESKWCVFYCSGSCHISNWMSISQIAR